MASTLAAWIAELEREAEERRRQGLERTLLLPSGIDFASNDYLALSRHPRVGARMQAALAAPPFGAPASRLLGGNQPVHEEIEERLAAWKGAPRALLFGSGYAANLGTLAGLIGREDRALSDALNHASIIDGLKLSGCSRVVYPHLDLDALASHLREPHPGGRTFIVTETLFSMDGEIAPLADLADLADRHGALLLLDDAHATGLYGARGSGLAEEMGVAGRAAAVVSTCGKALGLSGAFTAGPAPVIDRLLHRARSFVFSTAPLPALAAGIGAALDVIAEEPERRRRVKAQSDRLRDLLRARGLDPGGGEGPIVPVILGENERALRVAAGIRERGFDVRAVRPPSVPPGTARLRISVHADHTAEQLAGLCEALFASLASDEAALRSRT